MAKQNLSAPGLIDTNGKARAPLAVEGDVHCWNLAAPGMRVEMHSAALFRISHDLRREAAAHEWPAGLLLGKVDTLETGIVRIKITNVEPCDFRQLDSILLNSNLILGYYRITGQEELAFGDLDRTLARWRFPHPHRLFLLVRASGSESAEIRFFYWNGEEINSEGSEFPAAIRWAPPSVPAPSTPAAEIQLPGPSPTDEPVDWKQSAKARIAGFMLSVAAKVRRARENSSTLQGSIFQARAPDTGLEQYNPETSAGASGWRRLAKPAILASSLAIAIALIVTALLLRSGDGPKRLDLTSTLVGNSLRVSWTRGDPVSSASEGLLSIIDGEQKQELPLNGKQLHGETVIYIPQSDKVSFTLQVFSGGVVHRDSIMVFTPHAHRAAPSVSASPPTSIPGEPEGQVLSPSAERSAPPETVVPAQPQRPIKDRKAGQQVAGKPSEPGPTERPPVVDPASARASTRTRSAPKNSRAKKPAVPEPPIVLPSPERRRS